MLKKKQKDVWDYSHIFAGKFEVSPRAVTTGVGLHIDKRIMEGA